MDSIRRGCGLRHSALFFSAIGLVTLVLPGQASVLLSENFDGLTPQTSATNVGAFSAIGGTNVMILGAPPFNCTSPESGFCVGLNGSGGNPQGVLQTNTAFTLSPGVNYFLSFQLTGQGGVGPTGLFQGSTTVDFGPYSQTFSVTGLDVTTGIVTNHLVTVASTTVAHLTFTSNTPGDGSGMVLDNVLITAEPAPEPSSLILAGGALLGAALLMGLRTHR